MAAPALVALAHGSRDPRSAATINALVAEVRSLRPDLKIERAFLDLAKPSLDTTIDRLARKHDEIVVVPLLLTEAFHAKVDVPSAVAAAAARRADVQIRATPILGLEARFLEVLDLRMREALSSARARELDALALAAAGSSDPLANQSVARAGPPVGLAPQAARTAAFASSSPPATGRRRCARSARRAAATSRSPRSSWPPACCPNGQGAGARGRRRRRLGAPGRPPGDRPHGARPLRRRRRRGGACLIESSVVEPFETPRPSAPRNHREAGHGRACRDPVSVTGVSTRARPGARPARPANGW